ncbi:MAG: GAF domain-containing protein [Spirochaetales bacterium]|nr:GAF domain-containing protein [Spirochaetales bacterium]
MSHSRKRNIRRDRVWANLYFVKCREASERRFFSNFSQQFLKEAEEAGEVGTYCWFLEQDRWQSSPLLDRLFGIGTTYPRNLLGWFDLVDETFREPLRIHVEGVLAGLWDFDYEYQIVRPDTQERRWIHGKGRVQNIVSDEGIPLGRALLGAIQDITSRKQHEVALERMTRLYEALSQVKQVSLQAVGEREYLEHICRILVISAKFRLAWVGREDPQTHQILPQAAYGDLEYLRGIDIRTDSSPWGQGPSGEVIREKHPVIANNLEQLANFQPWTARARAHQFQSSANLPVLRDGKVAATLNVYATSVNYFGAEEVSLLEEVSADIALTLDRWELAAAQRRAEEERRVLEARLAQVERLESLGSLAGGVAHDMNNVLGAILNTVATLRAVPEGGSWEQALTTVTQACLRGRSVVQHLLYFAQKGLQHEVAVNLNDLVNEVVDLLKHTTLQKIHFSLDLQNLPCVQADPSALTHALMNLCVNAVDAMPEGGTITITTRQLHGIDLSVRDTGLGMTSEVLSHAMDPFFTTKELGKGTGLGLSQVFGTMRAHEGQLTLESFPGQGTTATMHFPTSRTLNQDGRCFETPPEDAETPGQLSLKVLLVDDDPLIRDSLIELLELLGHSPTAAAGGQEALNLLGAGYESDVIILDMNMPGMNGAQTLAKIQEIRPSQAVLVTTGYTESDLGDLAKHGKVMSLSKPFTAKELRTALAAILALP